MSSILMAIPSRLEGDNDNGSDDDADLDGFFPPRLAFGLTRPPRMVGSCWFPVERRPTTLRRFFRSFSLYFESCWYPVERKPTTLRRFSSTCCLSLLITWTTDQFSSDYFDYQLILLLTTLTVDFYDF